MVVDVIIFENHLALHISTFFPQAEPPAEHNKWPLAPWIVFTDYDKPAQRKILRSSNPAFQNLWDCKKWFSSLKRCLKTGPFLLLPFLKYSLTSISLRLFHCTSPWFESRAVPLSWSQSCSVLKTYCFVGSYFRRVSGNFFFNSLSSPSMVYMWEIKEFPSNYIQSGDLGGRAAYAFRPY